MMNNTCLVTKKKKLNGLETITSRKKGRNRKKQFMVRIIKTLVNMYFCVFA